MRRDKDKEIGEFFAGINQDISPQAQPRGTYRFALNAINETETGDTGFRSNEESNEKCAKVTPGFIPIGKCYISHNETIIFSVSADELVSEIGILNDECGYVVHVNDSESDVKDKLGFKLTSQIDSEYKLRRGCEQTVYFVDPKPRYFNFSKPEQFKVNNKWIASKFDLQKKVGVFPTIDSVEVLDSTGNLTPGSYSILVQHLDEDFNGTEFYELVKDIIIYNDSLKKNFADIEGSSNIGEVGQPFNYSKTDKAIKITLDAVDKNFAYVRFAFAERTSGNGSISKVKYSEPVSVNSPLFIYTGDNASQDGTIEEVELFNLNAGLSTAGSINQIDNMLILSDVAGDKVKLCELQKYASKITADCFVKDIILTSIQEEHNSKNPLASNNGIGCQPGDIYSEGIMYIFDDYSVSPVCHIPGKSTEVAGNHIFSPESGVYPMSNTNNANLSEVYLEENSSCSGSYWGVDSEGTTLKNKPVRHHRFPTRDEAGIGFVQRIDTTGNIAKFKQITLTILGEIKKSDDTYTAVPFTVLVKFKRNGVDEVISDTIFPDSNIKINPIKSNIFEDSDTLTDIHIFSKIGDVETEIVLVDNTSAIQPDNLTYKLNIGSITDNNIKSIYKVPIFGLKFSNIIIPPESIIGKKIIGYQIVRQERKDSDKNILDTAVIFPMMKSGRNVSTALLAPEYFNSVGGPSSTCEGSEDGTKPTCYNISKRNIMLVTPGHKFMDKTYDGFTSIEQVGVFNREYVARSASSTQNVYEGSSATGNEDKKTTDDDGFSLRQGYRFTGVKYAPTSGTPIVIPNTNTRMYNLNAINYAETEDNQETLYNLACDNKALILSSVKDAVDLRTYGPNKNQFPYVYIKKDNSSFYQNFRSNPYYLSSTEIFSGSTCKVFGGDTHIVPMRYSNHVFGNAVAAIRRTKVSAWAAIGAGLLAVVSLVLAPFTAGASFYLFLAATFFAASAILTGAAALVEASKFDDIYRDKWQANLDKTVFDFIYARLFIREYPERNLESYEPDPLYLSWKDDTFRWFGDIVGDLWFETPLNISLRVPPNSADVNYLLPLKSYMGDKTSGLYELSQAEYVSNNTIGSGRFHRYIDPAIDPTQPEEWFFYKKIVRNDKSTTSGILYTGISTPQVYLINPDYNTSTGIKRFYTIPIQYDCCSDCTEEFPLRMHYSQQSFQEEKIDNYRVFLPNNYIDIEGSTGKLVNVFTWYNNLFAHTQEGLWQMGRNYKERVTENVVSFIGTGSYFEIPPQKMLDNDTGSSAGTQHKWGFIKTPSGIFFPSENQRKMYHFDGKRLNAISDLGLSNWFKNNMEIQFKEGVIDNPSNPNGTGFIAAYDTKKERVLFTKKDIGPNQNNSWTISFSLTDQRWISWHSYIPSFYIYVPDRLYSWVNGNDYIWKHNKVGEYQKFYGKQEAFIFDYVAKSDKFETKIWDEVSFIVESKKFDPNSNEFFSTNTFFNKVVFYNTTQCTGLMNVIVKDGTDVNYLHNQVNNIKVDEAIVDRTDKDWNMNSIRDTRIDYTKPIWLSSRSSIQSNYYIDKVLNTATMSFNKDWSQLESFRDKYLSVRLIFDKFVDTKLIMNFSNENEKESFS